MMDLLKSKKFIAALIAVFVMIAGSFGLELDPAALIVIVTPIITYILAQGVSDIGKEKAKVEKGK